MSALELHLYRHAPSVSTGICYGQTEVPVALPHEETAARALAALERQSIDIVWSSDTGAGTDAGTGTGTDAGTGTGTGTGTGAGAGTGAGTHNAALRGGAVTLASCPGGSFY